MTETEDVILAFDLERRNNAMLMADARDLGWLSGAVLDATYGRGRFWTIYRPKELATNDLDPDCKADAQEDWTLDTFAERIGGQFGAVVFDPPYKLQGTPSDSFERMNGDYGVSRKKTNAEILADMVQGMKQCFKAVEPKGFLLVKCQDQIAGSKLISQTGLMNATAAELGLFARGALHLNSKPRPQRNQKAPRNNYSTLLAFQRRAGKRHKIHSNKETQQ